MGSVYGRSARRPAPATVRWWAARGPPGSGRAPPAGERSPQGSQRAVGESGGHDGRGLVTSGAPEASRTFSSRLFAPSRAGDSWPWRLPVPSGTRCTAVRGGRRGPAPHGRRCGRAQRGQQPGDGQHDHEQHGLVENRRPQSTPLGRRIRASADDPDQVHLVPHRQQRDHPDHGELGDQRPPVPGRQQRARRVEDHPGHQHAAHPQQADEDPRQDGEPRHDDGDRHRVRPPPADARRCRAKPRSPPNQTAAAPVCTRSRLAISQVGTARPGVPHGQHRRHGHDGPEDAEPAAGNGPSPRSPTSSSTAPPATRPRRWRVPGCARPGARCPATRGRREARPVRGPYCIPATSMDASTAIRSATRASARRLRSSVGAGQQEVETEARRRRADRGSPGPGRGAGWRSPDRSRCPRRPRAPRVLGPTAGRRRRRGPRSQGANPRRRPAS